MNECGESGIIEMVKALTSINHFEKHVTEKTFKIKTLLKQDE